MEIASNAVLHFCWVRLVMICNMREAPIVEDRESGGVGVVDDIKPCMAVQMCQIQAGMMILM